MTNARPFVRRTLARISRTASSLFSKIKGDPDFFLKCCSHIIHVGANSGQERELYHSYGLSVDWIEPIPAVYEQLVHNIQSYPKQVAIKALLTDHGGDTVKLNIATNCGASSSIFDLALHRDIWPEIDYVGHLQFQSETLDWLLEQRVVRSPVDAIIIDTQGSELLVLKGAEAALRGISYLKVEAADFESYKGGTTVEAIETFLKERSFRLLRKTKFAQHPSGGGIL
jgi:FkbM family methyltransferase